jgi:hypothetical protein
LIFTGLERQRSRRKLGAWQSENFGSFATPPQFGICEYCNEKFSGADAEVQRQFELHKCERKDFAQNAARIVNEATENK